MDKRFLIILYASYRNGVICTNSRGKSLYADAFFVLTNLFPTSICVSDDRKPNTQDLLEYGQRKAIPTEIYHFIRVMLLHHFI